MEPFFSVCMLERTSYMFVVSLSSSVSSVSGIIPRPRNYSILYSDYLFALKQDAFSAGRGRRDDRQSSRQGEVTLLMRPSGCSQHPFLALAQRLFFSSFSLSILHAAFALCTHSLFMGAFISNLIEKQGEESHLNIIRPNGTDRVP